MSHVLHELADELPEFKERIHELKISDAHFGRLFDEYHTLNREIHRAESNGVNIADEHHEQLKRQRLALKDELYEMLRA